MDPRVPSEEVAIRIATVGLALAMVGLLSLLGYELLTIAVQIESDNVALLVFVGIAMSFFTRILYKLAVDTWQRNIEDVTQPGRLVELDRPFFTTSLWVFFLAAGLMFFITPQEPSVEYSVHNILSQEGIVRTGMIRGIFGVFMQIGGGMALVGSTWGLVESLSKIFFN